MAEVTASMVKDLRERTGAGMMDCKNALVEAGGDMAKAAEVIQKKGLAKAVKAAGRIAADGAIVSSVSSDGQHGVLVEVNCQTDFVARGDDFKNFAKTVAEQALASSVKDVEALQNLSVGGKTLREQADALTAKSGEKHAIRRLERFDVGAHGVVTTYIHHGARLGVLVELASEKGATPDTREFADEIALQVASMGARFVRKEDAPKDSVEKQREIFVAQMKNEEDEAVRELDEWKRRMAEEGGDHSDKVKEHLKTLEKKANAIKSRPEPARANIVDGKVGKWLSEMTLLEQASVKDTSKTIAQLLADFAGKNGKTNVARIARFELGEGVEKAPAKDFATEVAEMAAGAAKH
jgi:elongation factor Ts